MFTVEEFVASCQKALKEHTPEQAVQELVAQVMSDPLELEAALGTPPGAKLTTLHHSSELTVLNIIWPPGISLYPHEHNMWAVIGLYGGQEDNTFYTRNKEGTGLIRTGAQELHSHDAIALPKDAIHAVANPRSEFTGAIHVYGGNFFEEPRSQWASEESEEVPYNVEQVRRVFQMANKRWLAQQQSTG